MLRRLLAIGMCSFFTRSKRQIERNVEKKIDISLELLYTLSKIRNTNLKGDDFYEI